MMQLFTYGSVCSGIEAASIAWEPLGWKPAFFSEIDKFPRAVLKHHWPKVPLHGDFTTIRGDEYGPIDLLVGGTPCQSFSIAGLRGGMDDQRGNLSLEFLRLLERTGARWMVWENVPGVLSSKGGRDFGSFLGALRELGFQYAYRVLDAQYFGVPQRRRRVFVVAYSGTDAHPAEVLFERHSLCGHPPPGRKEGQEIAGTLEASLGRSRGAGTSPGSIVQGNHWEDGPHPTLNQSNNVGGIGMSNQELFSQGGAGLVEAFGGGNCSGPIDVAATLTAKGCRQDFEVETFVACHSSGHGKYSEGFGTIRASGGDCGLGSENLLAFSCKDDGRDVVEGISPTLRSMNSVTGHQNGGGQVAVAFAQNSRDELREMPYSGALSATPGMKQTSYVREGMTVRRLTPLECERLQGIPDNHTRIPWRNKPAEDCPDGPRYKSIGNSMARPVMRWIGQRIKAVEARILYSREAAE
ncbi:DNA cytosine methyltransferase [Kiloniella laminariae]|uniref:DNA (cytosine-5-)-methyltransferase n=1 Tax=Kiloniella laminariae TaxID=454162 RepID=A0ABT4LKS0_9PROT|nr:DNA cytosine methyltransferase [Kiloniella laminariae]MCZ4281672.1 DNA cytosine methyltransferase [Kiloniella laminariae]